MVLGTDAERDAVKRAYAHSSRKSELVNVYDLNKNKDVEFNFTGKTEPNGDIAFVLNIQNNASESRAIKIQMTTAAKYYTGVPGEEILSKTHNITVNAGKGNYLSITIFNLNL